MRVLLESPLFETVCEESAIERRRPTSGAVVEAVRLAGFTRADDGQRRYAGLLVEQLDRSVVSSQTLGLELFNQPSHSETLRLAGAS